MGGIGFVGLLTVCLIVLELTGLISIGWIWVLAPIWISAILWTIIVIGVAIISYIAMRRF